jgi:hypothetical protein
LGVAREPSARTATPAGGVGIAVGTPVAGDTTRGPAVAAGPAGPAAASGASGAPRAAHSAEQYATTLPPETPTNRERSGSTDL